MGALFATNVLFEGQLVLHVDVVDLEITLFGDDLADGAGVGDPFLLLAVPVVVPEVLVRGKHWQLKVVAPAVGHLLGKD